MIDCQKLFTEQMMVWPEAREAYSRLSAALTREIDVDGDRFIIQHNPARVRSSAARLDREAIAARRCFLCRENRPEKQLRLDFEGMEILVNPFPIFPLHLTIAAGDHRQQLIAGEMALMGRLALEMPVMTITYNGPECGASAPDHFHFQGVESSRLPIWEGQRRRPGMIRLTAATPDELQAQAEAVMRRLPVADGSPEPRVNILTRVSDDGTLESAIIPRRRLRPLCYTSSPDSPEGFMISPAMAELAGVIVTPRLIDFERLDADSLRRILDDVCFTSLT